MERKRHPVLWLGSAALAVLGCAAAATWGGAAYLRLVRLDVSRLDAWARVATAGREHVELVANLLREPGLVAGLAPQAATDLRSAKARAASAGSPLDLAELRSAHAALAAGIAAARQTLDAGRTGGELQLALAALSARAERVEQRLARSLADFERAEGDYRAAASSFPATLVASVAAAGPLP